MGTAKIAISIDEKVLMRLDEMVEKGLFRNRSRAIQDAVEEKLDRLEGTRLARESAKLDPKAEKAMADEGLAGDLTEWPEY